ncbi:MAG: hypothetical protein C4576_24775 [Desulfobacteraceae bacterium]|nr:MAG: hypothetical protein C4576_24775 [Desulfobacteraceae bacterium]
MEFIMERTLYNKNGEAVAYIAEDYHSTIYLWEGLPAAYLYQDEHVYGYNGRHLGWFKGEVLFNHKGERVGFLYTTCPVSVIKPPVKSKKAAPDEIRSRWSPPGLPKLGYQPAEESLSDFLKQGLIDRSPLPGTSEKSPD